MRISVTNVPNRGQNRDLLWKIRLGEYYVEFFMRVGEFYHLGDSIARDSITRRDELHKLSRRIHDCIGESICCEKSDSILKIDRLDLFVIYQDDENFFVRIILLEDTFERFIRAFGISIV